MRNGYTLIELLLAITTIGLILGLSSQGLRSSVVRDAALIQGILEAGIIEARLSRTTTSIAFENGVVTRLGPGTSSKVRIRSAISCDQCEIEFSAKGVATPATIKLGTDDCLIVVSLRGRVRTTCSA